MSEQMLQKILNEIMLVKTDMREVKIRLTSIEQRVTEIEQRVTGIEQRVNGIEERVSGIEQRVTGLEQQVANIDMRVTGLEQRQDEIYHIVRAIEGNLQESRAEGKSSIERVDKLEGDVARTVQSVSRLADMHCEALEINKGLSLITIRHEAQIQDFRRASIANQAV
ncbi:hypothetical protein GJ688_13135 [Heliobacillus mobilis]|uniref:Uncharacterized protein n=1 Tax=Heliobacterium mobile TaxID=28064 RepID=A0A6I3SLT7_HELMO|nr:hypothetical protein [Heliobacterium mobile]MTV49918.1 hypothetical protein [Heliobacterium mobile]